MGCFKSYCTTRNTKIIGQRAPGLLWRDLNTAWIPQVVNSSYIKNPVTLNSVWDQTFENISFQNLTHSNLGGFENSAYCQVLLHESFYWLNLYTLLDQVNCLIFQLGYLRNRIPQDKEWRPTRLAWVILKAQSHQITQVEFNMT